MSKPPADALNDLPFLGTEAEPIHSQPSEVEDEIVLLFEQFRLTTLRYTLSLGLPEQDGKETTQEMFLAIARPPFPVLMRISSAFFPSLWVIQIYPPEHNRPGWARRNARASRLGARV
jgi:hypothetical protein